MHPDAQFLDLAHQQARSGVVDLPGHEPGRELDHVGFQPEVVGRLGRLEAQQPAADDGATAHALGVLDDRVEVLDRAVDEHAALVDAGDRRHERSRAGGQDHPVVGNLDAGLGDNRLAGPVDLARAVADMDLDPVLPVPLDARDRELGWIAVSEIGRQMHPVVCRSRLFAERDDPVLPGCIEIDESLAEAMAHQAVADDDNCLPCPGHEHALLASQIFPARVPRRLVGIRNPRQRQGARRDRGSLVQSERWLRFQCRNALEQCQTVIGVIRKNCFTRPARRC